MKLLHVDSSILGESSVSRALSAELVHKLARTIPGLEIRYRDLAAEPVPHLSGAYLAGASIEAADRAPELQQDLALGSELLEEFLAADIVVIGAPMYNFSISSQLKAWLDRLAVVGKTFRYTGNGPEGLAGGKRMVVASSRGGFYAGTSLDAIEHQESYLKAFFGFLGIDDIQFVRAEGIALGAEQRTRSVEAARQEITLLAA
ncbi:MAG TPA: NAD(P)H-dependent oxidoreductase [Geminicoccus sp.]|jgi:FMN-dependent NADH-azoreductase|uniref:FMN-dependent NADH-azoreductase n=1 Tax=Geminicoccus sp. TaxID=2024832 RepID=UPI002E304376|nr:NAD(P)H-dependent oxidoreductase [Geminicoccus sp.]HEX2526748.1 NAD(P)H-dependent oxidoreductase [Geminicoccus sp.]